MKGVVEVYRGEEKILEEPNMLMDNLGSQIAFWMSLPRGFGEIPSASAIYDTSNYTVRAASLAKDAAGYNRHAHISPNHDVDQNIISVESRHARATSYKIEEEATYQDTSPLSVVSSNVIVDTTATDWTTSTGWLEITGTGAYTILSANNGAASGAYQDALIVGKSYLISFTIFDYVSGDIAIKCGNQGEVITFNTANGHFSTLAQCIGDTKLYFMGGGTFTGKIYNIRAKELSNSKLTSYTVLPENSKPTMQRLETNSTSSLSIEVLNGDLGHNLNLLPSGNGANFKGGCYAPSGAVTFKLYRNNSTPISVSFPINHDGYNSPNGVEASSIDSKGFIKVTVSSLIEGNLVDETTQEYFRGLLISYDDATWSYVDNLFSVKHILGIQPVDVVCLNFFGGVYTIGLWGFDIPKMISKGMYPPYTAYDMDEIEYKLFARKTFNKDLTYHDDITSVDFLKIIWRFNFS